MLRWVQKPWDNLKEGWLLAIFEGIILAFVVGLAFNIIQNYQEEKMLEQKFTSINLFNQNVACIFSSTIDNNQTAIPMINYDVEFYKNNILFVSSKFSSSTDLIGKLINEMVASSNFQSILYNRFEVTGKPESEDVALQKVEARLKMSSISKYVLQDLARYNPEISLSNCNSIVQNFNTINN